MKKIIIAIAVLIISHFTALGVISALYPVSSRYDRPSAAMPDVECFEFSSGGGIAGRFRYAVKVWQDAGGYHLNYKEYEKPERTFTLTRLEYLQCTAFSRKDIDVMSSFEGAKVYDGFYTTVRIKFKGMDEVEIPAKCYDGQLYNYPMENALQIAELKKGSHENDHIAQINRCLSNYSRRNNVDSYIFSYHKNDRKNREWNNRMFFSKGILILSKEIVKFEQKCARKFIPEECTVVDYEGEKAYVRAGESDGIVCFYVYMPESRDEIILFSSMPKGVSLEEYKTEFCSMLISTTNGNSRDKAVMIETCAFLAATFMTVAVMYFAGTGKEQ